MKDLGHACRLMHSLESRGPQTSYRAAPYR
jgi:hypothetical protein